jgi:hypothetical protein
VTDFNLIIPELKNLKIRRTKDEKASVFDLLRAVGASKTNATTTWYAIQERYKDVCSNIAHVQFEDSVGRKNKATPVVTLEQWLKILAVLPGAMGASYREKSANLVCRYLSGDADLALDILYREGNKEQLEKAKKRLLVRDTNKQTATLAYDQGHSVGAVHNQRYAGLYKKNCKQLKQDASEELSVELSEADTPLDYMSEYDLGLNWLANKQAQMLGNATAVGEIAQTLANQHEKIFGTQLTPSWEAPMSIKSAKDLTKGQLGIPLPKSES